ncbi:MAG: hypothetical protein LBC40_05565 [Dysgonamonadaceae bacterium]|jgi:predicted translin family RNA/ssDNA-binding protein|nr:hypothetical protein [Dysgonamonadaceae bacterium]
MSLDIQFFKNDVDFRKLREDIDATYTKLQAVKTELEELEDDYEDATLSAFNITHNLNKMAEAVGLYEVLWRPEEIGITIASQMIDPLEKGLKELEANPDKYKAYNPPNGWGNYEGFVSFCNSVLQKCREYPDAVIEAAR